MDAPIGSAHQCHARGLSREDMPEAVVRHEPSAFPSWTCPSVSGRILIGADTLMLVSEGMERLRGDEVFDVSVSSPAAGPLEAFIAETSAIAWKRYAKADPQGFSEAEIPGFLR